MSNSVNSKEERPKLALFIPSAKKPSGNWVSKKTDQVSDRTLKVLEFIILFILILKTAT